MSKRLFTDVEVAEIAKNPFVKRVSNKGISYTDDFKVHFIVERQKGKFNNQIFQEAGFPVETLGEYRINSFADRWMKRYRAKGIEAIKDNRKGASGRPRLTELSTEEKLKRAQLEIELLKQENELLKKLDFAERRGNELTKAEKFRLIKEAADRPHSLPITRLCELLEVSTSGYYAHRDSKKREKDSLKTGIELLWRDLVIEGMNYKKVEKGSRALVMYFKNRLWVRVNRKKIQRIMRKFGLFCKIRRANPYKRLAKATKEHRTVPNLLERNFKQGQPGKVLLTDITYLPGKNGFMGYLSTILDGETKEILAYSVSDRIKLDIALETVNDLMAKHGPFLPENCLIHSDQGVHYTSPTFQKLMKKYEISQSMSRRGNCWDNAPQESWFGHLKDEIHYHDCQSLAELKAIINDYIYYYNCERAQWHLKKLTPVQYRNQLLLKVA